MTETAFTSVSASSANSASTNSIIGINDVKKEKPHISLCETTSTMTNANGGWNPANTRVFDVYMNNSSSQTSQLLDIFSCEGKDSKIQEAKPKCSTSDSELFNSGIGKRPKTLTDEFFEKMKRTKIALRDESNDKPIPSLSLPIVKQEAEVSCNGVPKIHSIDINTPPTTAASSNITPLPTSKFSCDQIPFGQTDKWPSQTETAFIAALRLIIKNGTSKFKILDKNYGRNELISLFVQYHTGEVRTKKQISSHIQVWKKSIMNKLSSNFKLNALDKEMLQLIEEGAPQNNESIKLFYSWFEDIVSSLSKNEAADNRPSPIPTYSYLLTPASSATTGPQYTCHSETGLQQLESQSHSAQTLNPGTPLDYAKSIYGSLKTYKCVPVQVHEQPLLNQEVKSVPQQQVYMNASQPEYIRTNQVLQTAKDLELQQRQLIENLSHASNQVKLPPVSPDLYIRNVQQPLPQQQNTYQPSQTLASGPTSHYPIAYQQLQHNADQVPVSMVLPPHAYYQQPQVYVPVSAGPGRSNNCNVSKFHFPRLAMNEISHTGLKSSLLGPSPVPSPVPSSSSLSNQGVVYKGQDKS